MAVMQVEFVSPEKRLASMEAEQVALPGGDGDFTAMPGHVPTATTLRPGVVRVVNGGSATEYLIAGGFAEITGETISILAEFASTREDATKEMFEPQMNALDEMIEKLDEGDTRHAEMKRHKHELTHLYDNLIPR